MQRLPGVAVGRAAVPRHARRPAGVVGREVTVGLLVMISQTLGAFVSGTVKLIGIRMPVAGG
jgi:hypothetical protein